MSEMEAMGKCDIRIKATSCELHYIVTKCLKSLAAQQRLLQHLTAEL